jgi:hypothetical protein
MHRLLLVVASHKTTNQLCIPKWRGKKTILDNIGPTSNLMHVALHFKTQPILLAAFNSHSRGWKRDAMTIILSHHQPSNLTQLVVKQWFLGCANKSHCVGGTLPKGCAKCQQFVLLACEGWCQFHPSGGWCSSDGWLSPCSKHNIPLMHTLGACGSCLDCVEHCVIRAHPMEHNGISVHRAKCGQ